VDNRFGEMVADLGVSANLSTLDALEANPELGACLVEVWHRQVHLAGRLDTLAAAMDRVFPDWRSGPMACLPNCQGACCQD
jgi:hypothetical protein